MTATNLTDKIIYVKNLQRAGKVSYNSRYGLLDLEVYKQKGGTIYLVKIDGVCKGINRTAAEDCWLWIAEYLGVPLEQEVKVTKSKKKVEKVIKKSGQSNWS